MVLILTVILLLEAEWASTSSELGPAGTLCCNGKRQITLEFGNAKKKAHKITQILSYLLHSEYSLGYE